MLCSASACWSVVAATADCFAISEHAAAAAVDEATPAAASNGKNSLIVWKDNRLNNQPYHRGQYLLYGRRFDLQGNAIDATSFFIQDEPFLWNNEGLTLPTVGQFGRDYLVVWVTRFRNISARRVLADGTLGTNQIQIAQTGAGSGRPALATTLRGGLVAWTERVNNNGDIYATLLDRNGNVTGVVPVAVDESNAQHPVAASVGNNYLVLWREITPLGEGVMKAALVTQAGAVTRLDQFPSAYASWLTVASNGRKYFVASQTGTGQNGHNELFGSVLNSRGKILKQNLPLAAGDQEQSLPMVLPFGQDFTVLWRENPYVPQAQLYALPVSAAGTPKSGPAPMTSEMGWSGYGSAITVAKTNVLMVLEQKTPDYYDNGYLSRVHGNLMPRAR